MIIGGEICHVLRDIVPDATLTFVHLVTILDRLAKSLHVRLFIPTFLRQVVDVDTAHHKNFYSF